MQTALVTALVALLVACGCAFGYAAGRIVTPAPAAEPSPDLSALAARIETLRDAAEADRETAEARYNRLRAAIMRRAISDPSPVEENGSESVLAMRARLGR